MYLKALEIQGFKSFPDKTRLSFDKDITAIVGPNGSGKSNISDALLWVMGEQRSRQLRGGKMEDVIFGGTEKRSPMGFAQVSLTLDNSTGMFDIDSDDVTITRRYYRTGESEYMLNHESCRLRDITTLLMDTGLGRDGYSIIGQGKIADIVSAKSTDRREIFEEAAGISLYRFRKEEAERKLARTDENLVRINDKAEELELQVGPLKRQSETAKRYLVLHDEQRDLEVSVWMDTLDKLAVSRQQLELDSRVEKENLAGAQQKVKEYYEASEEYAERMRSCDIEAEKVRTLISEAESFGAENDAGVLVIKSEISHSQELIERTKRELGEQGRRSEDIKAQIAQNEERLTAIADKLSEDEAAVDTLRNELMTDSSKADDLKRKIALLTVQEGDKSAEAAKYETEAQMQRSRAVELTQRHGSMDEELKKAEQDYEDACSKLREAEKQRDIAQEQVNELRNVIAGRRMIMQRLQSSLEEKSETLKKLSMSRHGAEMRRNTLTEMEKEYDGFGKAVKNVMRAATSGTLRGIYGPISKLIKVEDRYTLAIETALGGAIQNIVTDRREDGKNAMEFLRRTDGGRATFDPVDALRPRYLKDDPSDEEGFIGIASELVECDDRFRDVISNHIGLTIVVESLPDAIRISKKYGDRLRIVSLDGQLINAGGSMTGGSSVKSAGILSRANEIEKLTGEISSLQEKEKKLSEEIEESKRSLAAARYESETSEEALGSASAELSRCEQNVSAGKILRDTADDRAAALEDEAHDLGGKIAEITKQASEAEAAAEGLRGEIERIISERSELSRGSEEFDAACSQRNEKIASLRQEQASLRAEEEATKESCSQLRILLNDSDRDNDRRLAEIEELKAAISEKESKIADLEAKRRDISLSIEQHNKTLQDITGEKLAAEKRRTEAEKGAQEENRAINELSASCSRLEQQIINADKEERTLTDKLWDSYELTRTAANEKRIKLESLAAANKRISEIKRDISKLGSINLGAIEEYERVNERYEFLSSQKRDVEKAKKELEKIISEITSEMKEIFTVSFNNINTMFKQVFTELFQGGKADLQLEDEEDVLSCGIEIKVQPPGKAVTSISLLSGGEKSFVAIALYYAVMKIRPTPFCVMDEVEAALDDVNVDRSAQYMRTLAGKTQFIVITHRRGTMEEADTLFGVTMQEKGVTSVLSVDLNEAMAATNNIE